MKKLNKNNKGFSLVELIVVIAIMAVLVGVAAPQFIQYVNKSRAATDLQNLQQVKAAVEVYYADYEGSTSFHIEYAANTKTVTAANTTDPGALTNAGLSAPTLKHGAWSAISMTYALNATSGKWEWTISGSTTVGSTTYNLNSL